MDLDTIKSNICTLLNEHRNARLLSDGAIDQNIDFNITANLRDVMQNTSEQVFGD
jgi:hypothetical protein